MPCENVSGERYRKIAPRLSPRANSYHISSSGYSYGTTKSKPPKSKYRFRRLLVHRKRFELLAFGSVDRRSIQLS